MLAELIGVSQSLMRKCALKQLIKQGMKDETAKVCACPSIIVCLSVCVRISIKYSHTCVSIRYLHTVVLVKETYKECSHSANGSCHYMKK